MKTIKRAVLCLAIAATGLVSTSCDSETVQQIINTILTNLTGLRGTTYTYEGSGSVQLLKAVEDGFEYGSDELTLTATMPMTFNGAKASLTVPDMTVGGAKMSGVMFKNLALTAGDKSTTFDVDDNTEGYGSLTVDGTSYDVSNLYIKGAVTSNTLVIEAMSIYFGSNNEYAVNITYAGTVPAE